MLLAVLLGIAGGAAIYGRVRPRLTNPVAAVGVLFGVAGLAVLGGAVGDRPAPRGLPGRARRAAGVLRRPPARGPRPVPRHDAAGDAGAGDDVPAPDAPRGLRRPLGPGGLGAPLRLEHRRGHRRGAPGRPRPRPAPRASSRPTSSSPRSSSGGGGVGPRRGGAAGGRRFGSPPRRRWWPCCLLVSPSWTPWDPVLMSSGVHRYGLEWRDRVGSVFDLGDWLREQQELRLLPRGVGGGGRGLEDRRRAPLPLRQRQDRRRQRGRGRGDPALHRPRPDAAPRQPAPGAGDRLGSGGDRGLGGAVPGRVPRVRGDRARGLRGGVLLRRAQRRAAPGRALHHHVPRRAQPPAAHPRAVGRDRLRALQPLDLRGLEPLHPGVLRGGARLAGPPGGLRAVVPLLPPRPPPT